MWILRMLIALLVALANKAAGRYFAANWLTDATGAKWTVGRHLESIRSLAIATAVMVVLVGATFLFGGAVAPWIATIGLGLMLLSNCTLGLLGGVSESLGKLLSKVYRFDEIQRHIEMKRRAQRVLRTFMTGVLLFLWLSIADAQAQANGTACLIGIDESASVDAADRARVIENLVVSADDYARQMGCRWVVVARFAGDGRFTPTTWIPVAPQRLWTDCRLAEPEALSGHVGIYNYVETVYRARKEEAVAACERKRADLSREVRARQSEFITALRDAMRVESRADWSRITEFLQGSLDNGYYRAVVLVSDGLDNPPVPLNLRVPPGIPVVLILTRSNPMFANRNQVLDRAREWAEVPGVILITAGELPPEPWSLITRR